MIRVKFLCTKTESKYTHYLMRGLILTLAYGEPDGEGTVQGVPGCVRGGLLMPGRAHSSDDHQGNLAGGWEC